MLKAWHNHGNLSHGETDFYPNLAKVGEARIPYAEDPLDYAASHFVLFPLARPRRITYPRLPRYCPAPPRRRENSFNHEGTAS